MSACNGCSTVIDRIGDSPTLGFVAIALPPNEGAEKVPYEVVRYDEFVRSLIKPGTEFEQAVHIGLGVTGEAGELADAIKREYIYEKPRHTENIVEEIGDLFWYIQAAMNHYGLGLQQILDYNARKLQVRYRTLKFSKEAAIERADKASERI